MKREKHTPCLHIAILLTLLVLLQSGHAFAGEVTGKVVAIFHEKVQLENKKWADKVSVTVANCQAGNQFVTTHYPLGAVSEDNYLSANFRQLATAARSTEQTNQFMNSVNGHATIKYDDQTKTIQKTTFWGYNWACGRNLDAGKGAITKAPVQDQPGSSEQIQAAPTTKPASNPLNKLRRFGF